jgi:hypothetical protein
MLLTFVPKILVQPLIKRVLSQIVGMVKYSAFEVIKIAVISFKGRHFQSDMILQSIRRYLAYALSYRDMEEGGVSIDHTTINRW